MSSRFRDRFPEFAEERLGEFEPGRLNAITDVAGVRVGHSTVRDVRKSILSGVTAIWPRSDVHSYRPRASGYVLNGAGEMTGLTQVLEWGLIETPILLTSTLNVGRVYDAAVDYLARQHPRMGLTEDVLIPVVAECDDSHLSRARLRPVGPTHVRAALRGALLSKGRGVVAEGSVGAGAGMIAFDRKGGIGTSSRVVPVGARGKGGRTYRLGALVNANVGVGRQLRIAGERVRGSVGPQSSARPPQAERSIIVVLATDAPLRPDQLRRLCVRAGMGLARAGSFASHGSGEIVLGFSTSLGEPRVAKSPMMTVQNIHDAYLNPFYEAAVECVEECVLNALVANASLGSVRGRDGHVSESLSWDEINSWIGR